MTGLLANRSPRERLLLSGLLAFVLIWLGVTQVWGPLSQWRAEITTRLPRMERALALAGAPAPLADPRPLQTLVTETAVPLGLRISRLQPLSAQVDLTLEDAPFDTVLLWIEALQRDHGVRLTDLTLTRRPASGIVGATLTMER
jgi:general secretion pathway protein M